MGLGWNWGFFFFSFFFFGNVNVCMLACFWTLLAQREFLI